MDFRKYLKSKLDSNLLMKFRIRIQRNSPDQQHRLT
jgi:hypothetical protein